MDARSMASTGEPVAWNSKQMQDSKVGTGESVTRNSVIDVDLETSGGYNLLSAESVSFRQKSNSFKNIQVTRRIGLNRWRADGIRVDDFPRIHYVADSSRDPKFDERLGL